MIEINTHVHTYTHTHTKKVPETLDDAILEKMHAPAKPDVPVITAEKLKEADGFLFGLPTR